MIKVKLLHKDAKPPRLGSEEAAGLDLCSVEDYTLAPGQRHTFGVGVALQIPKGFYGSIRPKRSLAEKYGIDVLAGTFSSSCREEVTVILLNTGDKQLRFKPGDKIAQMVIERHFSDMKIVVYQELDCGGKYDPCGSAKR